MAIPGTVRFLSILILLAALALAGCVREQPALRARRDGILLLGNGPEPQSLDPHVSTGTSELNIQMALYEGLVAPHPETLEPMPAVAESWELSADGRVYTFKLREQARWSDGQPVLARDFAAAWQRALDPAQGAPYAAMLYPIAGAEAYNRGELADFTRVGVRAVADRMLEVTLDRPVPWFLSLLLHPVWYPVPSHVASSEDQPGRAGPWTLPGTFLGNGPFVLQEWVPVQHVAVRRNNLYWDAPSVRLEGARFVVMDDPGAEERAFLAGQLHGTEALPPARVAAYLQHNAPELRIDPYLGTYYILLNTREGPLADPKVRRALALAIDRQALASGLLGAGQRPAGGFVPDNMPGYAAHIPVEHDPAAARALLADAGYPGGSGFPRIEYLFNSSESHRKIAEALQSMWREQLGIEIVLTNVEWRTYLQRRSSGDFQMARAVWIGDYVEPSTFLNLWTSDNGNNWSGWASAAYDALLLNAIESPDAEARMRRYSQAERFLTTEQVMIPLYHYVTVYLMDPSVRGWYSNLLDWHPLKHVYFE